MRENSLNLARKIMIVEPTTFSTYQVCKDPFQRLLSRFHAKLLSLLQHRQFLSQIDRRVIFEIHYYLRRYFLL